MLLDLSLPSALRDLLPDHSAHLAELSSRLQEVFSRFGYRRVFLPTLERLDVVERGLSAAALADVMKFVEPGSGEVVAIRPDITPQIARIEATRMRAYPLPHRLYYNGRVLRHAEVQTGRSREIFQSGVELIGLNSPEADAEMVAMAVEVLQGLGLENFKIDLGQVDFFRGIMSESGLAATTRDLLQEAIGKKDVSAVREILEKAPVADNIKEEIASLPRLYGGREVLAAAERVGSNDRSKRALENIAQVLEILDIYGVADYLTIDLGEIRGLDYHTGVTFEGFVSGLGEAVCGGGRYDDLTAKYGFPAPATGFAFNILTLLNALGKRPDVEASKTRDFLLFNLKEDRREVLEIAQRLRAKGFTTARDIIRRDFDNSLAYAKRMNIRRMLVIGGDYCADDEVYVVTVADQKGIKIKKTELFKDDFVLKFEP